MTRVTLMCGSVLVAGTMFVSACGAPNPPAAETQPAAAAEGEGGGAARAEQELLDDLAVANRILAQELAILDVQGHITARSKVNPNHYYIARFVAPGGATTSHFVENDLDSKPVDGPRNDQAREIYLHGEIFRARPDVMAVVHSHTPEFVAFGLSSAPLWSGDSRLPVWDIRPFNMGRPGIVSNPALGKASAEAMGKSEAVLLWGHGIALGAGSIAEAVSRVDELRDSAQAQLATIAAGGTWKPQPRAANDAATTERTWNYYKANVVKKMGGKILRESPPEPEKPADTVALAKRDIVLANRILASDEVAVLDTRGLVSVRNPQNPNSYFVAPRTGAGAVTAADVIERDMTKPDGDSGGLLIHDEIYKARPDVNAIVYGRTPAVVAFTGPVKLRHVVNGPAFVAAGGGLPVFDLGALDASTPLLSNPALAQGVAAALGKKSGVLLSGHGFVLTGGSIYNVTDRSYQLRMNATIQQQAMALRGKMTHLDDNPVPPAPEQPAQAQPAQQLGPPEGRGWVYWAENVSLE